ncbi:MAG: hypothetical protein WD750_06360 [Gammaproteobacteria bacterium]
MNEGQIKMRMRLLQAVDWLFLLAVVSLGVYAILNAEHRMIMGIITFIGLLLVHELGNYTEGKVARMRSELEAVQRQRKKL